MPEYLIPDDLYRRKPMALIYEKKGNTAYITINRPEVMNAMDPETYS